MCVLDVLRTQITETKKNHVVKGNNTSQMIKLTGAGVNHIMVSGNRIQHQSGEAGAGSTHNNVRESENFSKPYYYVDQLHRTCNRQEPKNGLVFYVFSIPPGCGPRSAPAWSQDGGQGENHKVKIEEAGARACPVKI